MTTQQNNSVRENGYSDDEISLYDLYRVLAKRKKLIIITFASILIVCAIYLLFAQKIYQVTAILFPPTNGDLYLTNIDVAKQTEFQPEQVFKLYSQELTSNERWYGFTKKEKNLFTDLSHDAQIRNPFKLDKDKDIPNLHVVLKYDTPDKATAAEIVQHYLLFAEQSLVDTLTQQIKSYITHNTKTLELDIQSLRESAKQARLDQIAQLENDLAIANKLGIVDNMFFSLAGKSGDRAGVLNIFTNNPATPTYLKGSKAISAELDMLKKRESDDPYIPDLRQKQDQLQKLKQVQFTPAVFHPYQLDGEINTPQSPLKPKKSLVLALGGILGLFLGIFVAFIAEFITKAREQELG